MINNFLISIYVPTYNGSECLSQTLSSIAPFLGPEVELIISDDCSSDDTVKIAEEYVSKYSNVSLHVNTCNLGMDGNFLQSASLSNADYIWFCGQDDLIGKEAICTITKILKSNNFIGLNCNFSQFNYDYSICNFNSFFDRASFSEYKKVRSKKLIIFESPQEYFKIFTQPPSFLPSVIMKRDLFLRGNPEKFNGTHFIQVGVFLENMHTGLIGALTVPLIKGRVPNNGWQQNGEKLINIMIGDIHAKKIAFDNNKYLPRRILDRDMLKFALNYPFLLSNAYEFGLKRKNLGFKCLEKIYSSRPLLLFLIKITHTINPETLTFITKIMKPMKRKMLRLRMVKDLKS